MTRDDGELPIQRRTLLRGVSAGSVVPMTALAGCDHHGDGDDGNDGNDGEDGSDGGGGERGDLPSGRVVDVRDEGVPRATVAAIWTGATSEPVPGPFAVTKTDQEGYFAFPPEVEEYRGDFYERRDGLDVILVAQFGFDSGNLALPDDGFKPWFGSSRYSHDRFFDTDRSLRILMNEQVQLSSVGSTPGNVFTGATVWRVIEPEYHTRQHFVIEARGEGGTRSGGRHDEMPRVGKGLLSLQVPEYAGDHGAIVVCSDPIQYDEDGSILECEPDDGDNRPFWTDPLNHEHTTWWREPGGNKEWGEANVWETFESKAHEPLIVPIRGLYGAAGFDEYTRADDQRLNDEDRAELSELGIQTALAVGGELPGTVATFIDLIGLAREGAKLVGEYVDFPESGDGTFIGDGASEFDPNGHDAVKVTWDGNPRAVVHQTSMDFIYLADDERHDYGDELAFAARGLWRDIDDRAIRLEHEFSFDPTRITPIPPEPPCEPFEPDEEAPYSTTGEIAAPRRYHQYVIELSGMMRGEPMTITLEGRENGDVDLYATLDGRRATQADFDKASRARSDEAVIVLDGSETVHDIGVAVTLYEGECGAYRLSVDAPQGGLLRKRG